MLILRGRIKTASLNTQINDHHHCIKITKEYILETENHKPASFVNLITTKLKMNETISTKNRANKMKKMEKSYREREMEIVRALRKSDREFGFSHYFYS